MTSTNGQSGDFMYKTKAADGKLNICGAKIAKLRLALIPKCSQRALADKLQLKGLLYTKNTIQCIESGNRFVTDIELKAIAQVLGVSADEQLTED